MDLTEKYQNTLNLPKTDFPMKASLAQKEPEQVKAWIADKIYQAVQEKNKSKPVFTLPDGPPYANGNIHIGHSLNKILKDFTVKYQAISGRRAVFIPGWDCHGLPIEHAVNKELGNKRREKSDGEIRQLCRQYAEKFIGAQKEQFKRLGVLADWDHPYTTMDTQYEADMIRALAKIYKNGFVYRGEKPVHWCWSCGTALAEAEVEYDDRKDPSIYVKFEVTQGLEKLGSPSKRTYVVIWTTTPWTLPANLAISIHPDFEYGLFEVESENWVLAIDLAPALEKASGKKLKLSKKFKGKDLGATTAFPIEVDSQGRPLEKFKTDGLLTRHPFTKSGSLVILGTHVTLDAGTGAVHTAPGHGQEDYVVSQKYKLKPFNPVDDWGRYTDLYSDLKGTKVFDANSKVVEMLRTSGHLIKEDILDHSFPHCWRCHNPVIFRATSQWFISMDEAKTGDSLRKRALREIKNVKWVPSWGENRITAMVENRPDWCISRQRLWGVPIPVFYCESCGKDETSAELMNKVADLISREGLESWYSSELSQFMTAGHKCTHCGHSQFRRGKDILDVWFDSGVCHEAVQKKREGLSYPANLYLEGSDQHRGWFQSSLMTAVAMNDSAPFKSVLTHGFVNDAQGRKMSKSLGNVIDPLKFMEKSGAEILRLWTAYVDYSNDLQAGQESFDRVSESYRRVRNTCRYILGNLNDFDPSKDLVEYKNLLELDKWALARLARFIQTCRDAFEAFEYHTIYHALQNFCTVDLSAIYLDILKDRLYTFKTTGPERRSAQTVIYLILDNMVKSLNPILSFLCEEVYKSMPGKKEKSVFLTNFPQIPEEWKNEHLEKNWQQIFSAKEVVQKSLEEARQSKMIGSSLEAKVILSMVRDEMDFIKQKQKDLPSLFIVSQVELKESAGTSVKIEKANGEKCVRCWNYSTEVGSHKDFPGICPKCVKALS